MIKAVISGGGTGGHILPAVSISQAMLKIEPSIKIVYIGGKGQREASIVPKFGLDFLPIHVEGFPRSFSKKWFKVIYKVPRGFIESLSILKKFSPHIVIGTGGYVCGPVLLAAWIRRIPILIQEQNAIPGITNRIVGRWADEIHVPFQEAVKFFPEDKTKITPNPIREEITTAYGGKKKLGLNEDKTTILFMGGSQGASSINAAAVDAMNRLTDLADQIQAIHQTGNLDIQSVKEAYNKLPFTSLVKPFFDNMEDVYSATDMAVCRAGASTLAELTACGIPAVLIPYPYATNDHQTFNALALEKNGAALMIKNADLNGEVLENTIRSMIHDKEKLVVMSKNSRSMGSPNAARDIAEAALSIALNYEKSKR